MQAKQVLPSEQRERLEELSWIAPKGLLSAAGASHG